MGKKVLTAVLSTFTICLYIAIIMYVFFAVLHIDTLENFVFAIAFEIIGFIFLLYFILGNILTKPIETGYFVPLVMVTILYTIIRNAFNIALITVIPNVFFVLGNFILLFVYCLISIPMFIMGRR